MPQEEVPCLTSSEVQEEKPENLLQLNPTFDRYKKPTKEHVKQMFSEFNDLQCRFGSLDPSHFSVSLSMMPYNRYPNVLACDRTIFPPVSSSKNRDERLYINGNMYDLKVDRQFVGSQAPVPCGLTYFYDTLISYNINLIVMLTEEVESGLVKAVPYWPPPNTTVEKPMKMQNHVLWRDASVEHHYYFDRETKVWHRHFFVEKRSTFERDTNQRADAPPPHRVEHLQYIGWPDHAVPSSANALDPLLQRMRAYTGTSPILVHCSAGVGRTATLVGCYAGLYHIRRGSFTNKTIYDLVATMRGSRTLSVQTVEQYLFMYQVLMSAMGVDTSELGGIISKRVQAIKEFFAKKGG